MQPSRSRVEAYFFGSPRRIGAKILFIKRADRLAEYALHLTDAEPFGHVWHGVTGKLHGEPVSVIATGVGPSLIGDAVYALSTPGATCLYSGTCGGLRDGLTVGDTFVAEEAVCGEGYTLGFGYAPFSLARGDPDVLQALKVALATAGARFRRWRDVHHVLGRPGNRARLLVRREPAVPSHRNGRRGVLCGGSGRRPACSRLLLGDRPAHPGQELF